MAMRRSRYRSLPTIQRHCFCAVALDEAGFWPVIRWPSTEPARFDELIAALPLAIDVPTKADRRSKAIADIESAKPRKARKGKSPAPQADWPLATEVAAIIEAKATTEPTTEPEPEPEPATEATTTAPALDPAADRRAKKTLAQRLRRAAAKAAVQWRGDTEMTAAAE